MSCAVCRAVCRAVCHAVCHTVCRAVCRAVCHAMCRAVCRTVCRAVCHAVCRAVCRAMCRAVGSTPMLPVRQPPALTDPPGSSRVNEPRMHPARPSRSHLLPGRPWVPLRRAGDAAASPPAPGQGCRCQVNQVRALKSQFLLFFLETASWKKTIAGSQGCWRRGEGGGGGEGGGFHGEESCSGISGPCEHRGHGGSPALRPAGTSFPQSFACSGPGARGCTSCASPARQLHRAGLGAQRRGLLGKTLLFCQLEPNISVRCPAVRSISGRRLRRLRPVAGSLPVPQLRLWEPAGRCVVLAASPQRHGRAYAVRSLPRLAAAASRCFLCSKHELL